MPARGEGREGSWANSLRGAFPWFGPGRPQSSHLSPPGRPRHNRLPGMRGRQSPGLPQAPRPESRGETPFPGTRFRAPAERGSRRRESSQRPRSAGLRLRRREGGSPRCGRAGSEGRAAGGGGGSAASPTAGGGGPARRFSLRSVPGPLHPRAAAGSTRHRGLVCSGLPRIPGADTKKRSFLALRASLASATLRSETGPEAAPRSWQKPVASGTLGTLALERGWRGGGGLSRA